MNFRRYEGRVDGVAGRLAIQHGEHLLSGLDGHLALGLLRGRPEVGRGDQFGVFEQRQVAGRFFGENVQGGAGQLSAFQSVQQSVLVHQLAAGDVDEAGVGFHHSQLGRRNQISGARRQGSVQGDKVGLLQHLVQRHHRHVHAGGEVRGDEGVVGTRRIPKLAARRATSEPTRPRPMMPRVLLRTSMPIKAERCHWPSFMEA